MIRFIPELRLEARIFNKGSIAQKTQKIILQIIIRAGRFFIDYTPKIGVFFVKIAEPAIMAFGRIVFKGVLFPMYLVYKPLKLRIQKILLPIKHSVWKVFLTRYIVHGFIIFLILIVTSQNIFAKENDNIFEGGSIIIQLIGQMHTDGETGETIIEEEKTGLAPPIPIAASGSSTSLLPEMNEIPADGESPASTGGAAESQILDPNAAGGIEPNEARASVEDYIVQGGDTISSIAEKFGISVNTILWANDLNERSLIRPDDKLSIPPVSGVLHKVKSGDTLDKIASRYSVSADQVIEFNRLADADDLNIDELLIIPGGVMPEAPRAAPQIRQQSGFAIRLPSLFTPPPPVKVSPGNRMQWPAATRKINQYFRGWIHTGVDLECSYGQANYAADDGVVSRSSWARGYGYSVEIDHGGGIRTLYGHNQKNLVRAGQRVNRGQAIGMCGSTGRSTGTHLHFEVIIGGRKVNPLTYL